ncbi:DUF2630 family protein [Jiangella alkaliphila]|uniref:DUF2630 domain-containing protein n=1 Tax=Jiangella alkaliphila TaxID=419479 RepID=A0A1H2FYZ1_9ACTN|nr:DUF2630 family protein [Jiangella alkaliphila]SDU12470.1 Protein of unknown function [Jiangella alkaliphila]
MQEDDIRSRINALVEDEHDLRQRLQAGEISTDDEHARLRQVEEQLDQCWDLLRQRRARVEAGQNPDEAAARPVDEVEKYLQ